MFDSKVFTGICFRAWGDLTWELEGPRHTEAVIQWFSCKSLSLLEAGPQNEWIDLPNEKQQIFMQFKNN